MKRDVQFVRALDAPYELVRDAVRADPQRMLGGRPIGEGRVEVPLTATLRGREVSRSVNLDVVAFEEPEGASAGSYLLMRADAVRRPDLFPHLEARLNVVPIDDDRTALFLVATYKPPLGIVGGAADALAMHRLAEESLNRLFDGIADRILGAASDG